jgi:hypothetical protein
MLSLLSSFKQRYQGEDLSKVSGLFSAATNMVSAISSQRKGNVSEIKIEPESGAGNATFSIRAC